MIMVRFSPDPVQPEVRSLWVGLVVCISLQISFLSPPFAYSIFYLKGIAPDIPLNDIYRGVIPFVLLQVLITLLCIIFPDLCLWLPRALSH